jgi:hypothetical protein
MGMGAGDAHLAASKEVYWLVAFAALSPPASLVA